MSGRGESPLPWVISILLHGALGVVMVLLPAEATHRPRPNIELVKRELPPEPKPEPEPEPPPPPAQDLLAMRRTVPEPQPAPEPEPEPEALPPPTDQPEVPPTFGIKLSGTAKAPAGLGVRVPEGQTLKAKPPKEVPKEQKQPTSRPARPGFKKSYGTGEKAPLAVVTTMPKVAQKVEAEYPEKVRELGIEGRVVLELSIDGQGRVTAVRVVTALHPLLDQAAEAAARKMRFSPAVVNGVPVAVKIPYTFTFVLD